MDSSREVRTLSREDYTSLRQQGYAGTVASLEVETPESWGATHWYMHTGDHGDVVLSPCNVERRGAGR